MYDITYLAREKSLNQVYKGQKVFKTNNKIYKVFLFLLDLIQAFQQCVSIHHLSIINRPGVAGAILQSPPSLINSLIHSLTE